MWHRPAGRGSGRPGESAGGEVFPFRAETGAADWPRAGLPHHLGRRQAAARARRHNAALDAEIDKALDEMAACRATQAQVARAARALDGAPAVGAAAAGTRFTSPAASRLRTELTGMDGSVRAAAGRLGALAGLLGRAAQDAELRVAALEAGRCPVSADGGARFVFAPGEMRALAGTLDRCRAALGRGVAGTARGRHQRAAGGAASAVEAERRSIGSQLSGTGSGLEAGSRYLTRTAEQVEQLDESGFFASTNAGVKVGAAIFGELADLGVHKSDPAGRARRWATALGALAGTKALVQAAGWQEWGAAARKLAGRDEWRSATTVQRLRSVLDDRVGAGLRANHRLRTPAADGPQAGQGWRKAGARAAGAAPYVGALADAHQYLYDREKLRRDEPQTGVSQALTDVRDVTALVGSSNHLAADVWAVAGPLGVPGAAINEGFGYGADLVVLGMDGTAAAAKGAVAAGGAVVDAAEGARDWAGRRIGAALRGAFG